MKKIFALTLLISILTGCIYKVPVQPVKSQIVKVSGKEILAQHIKPGKSIICGIILLINSPASVLNLNFKLFKNKLKIIEKNITIKPFRKKYKTLRILFNNVSISADKNYYFIISPEKDLEFWYYDKSKYSKGIILNNIQIPGDLFMELIYSTDSKIIIKDFLSKFKKDIFFMFFYLSSVVFILIVLIFSFFYMRFKK